METVFLDVDTQMDFLFPAGALYVPGAERLLPLIERLNRWAGAHAIPLVSTTDAHAEDDPEFRRWPHHCVKGALGQHKPAATLLEGRVTIPNRPGPLEIAGARQIVIEKQTVDTFEALHAAEVVNRVGAERAVVYGVVTEVCVAHAVRGLRRLGKAVTVVTDAIETLRAEDGERALEEMRIAGAMLVRSGEIIG